MDELEALKRSLKRERLARRSAEKLLEEKSLELFNKNEQLKNVNSRLGNLLDAKTIESTTFSKLALENPNPVIILNHSFNFVYQNDAALILLEEQSQRSTGFKNEIIKLSKEALKIKKHFITEINYGALSFGVSVHPVVDNDYVNLYFIDQSELKNTLGLLYKGEEKYRTIVELADDIIINTDHEGYIFYLNPKAEKVLGINKTEVQGRLLLEFISEDFKTKFQYFIENFTEKNNYLEFPIINTKGEKYWIGQNVIKTDVSNSGTSNFNNSEAFNILSISRDITAEKYYREVLKQSENQYKRIIGNMKLGLLEVDNDGIVVNVHAGLTDIIGFTNEDAKGKNASQIFHLDKESLSKVNKAQFNRINGEESTYEIKIKHKDGHWLTLMISGAPILNEKKEVIGSIGIHMDITDQKLYEQKLKEQTVKAEDSAKAKEIFLANMSHEIRTPLNAILGISELLSKTSLNNRQKEYNDIMISAATSLKIIIDGILDLTKISSGKMILEREPMSIRQVIKYCYESNKLRMEENGNLFHSFIDDEIHDSVLGDSTRLLQILNNLLSNSAKFTKSGKIELYLNLIYQTVGSQSVEFIVKDNGIGIDQDKLSHVFESFTQEDDSTTRKFGGTGLGLSITKDLIELYGGKIELKSEKGKGSVFSFEIDFEKTENLRFDKKQENFNEELIGLTVLVAEDNKFNQTLVKGVLEPYHVNLIFADNGQLAFDYLKNNMVDIVLMDIQMPVMNGIQCCKKIRKELSRQVPIIAVSANAFKEDIEVYLDSGMDDYLIKPFMAQGLLEKLFKWKNKNNKPLTSISDSIEITYGEEKDKMKGELFSTSKLLKMLSGNIEFVNESIETFRIHTPDVLDKMNQALITDDREKVSKLAHRLKASCNILSIDSIEDILLELESDSRILSEELLKEKVNIVINCLGIVVNKIQNLE